MTQTVLFVSIGIIFGARIEGGVSGVAILLVLACLMAIAVSGLGVVLALRTGSAEAVQGTFPLFFALLFFSSAFFPRETMTGWFRTVADINPISYLVEAMRDLVIDGVGAAPDADRPGRRDRAGGRGRDGELRGVPATAGGDVRLHARRQRRARLAQPHPRAADAVGLPAVADHAAVHPHRHGRGVPRHLPAAPVRGRLLPGLHDPARDGDGRRLRRDQRRA